MNGTDRQHVEDRDAVYYPYIHIRDRAWLNGTLLCFPHLMRMVPSSYPLRDDPWLREYFETAGRRNKPLLQTVDFWQDEVREVQGALAAKIEEDVEHHGLAFADRFKLPATLIEHGSKDSFQISQDRLIGIGASGRLYDVLRTNELIWRTSPDEFGIHPALGEAIMATVAMTLAARDGMDVVTPSGPVHDVLAARRAESVYDVLVRGEPVLPAHGPELVDDLASLVVVGAFNVAALSAKDLSKLHASGEDLGTFRAELAKHVASIPAMPNRVRREEYLQEKASDVLHHWHQHRLNISNFARSLYSTDALDIGESAAKDALEALIGGGLVSVASLGPGLIVGVVWYAAKRGLHAVKQARESPYRWLSRIHKEGATLLHEPLWEYRVVAPPPSMPAASI